jgi:hypothetical protein
MTDYTTRSPEEAKTLQFFSEENYAAKGLEWTQHRQLVAMVWRARWSASLTIEQINETAKVLGNLYDTPDLQEMVTLLARKRILRTRRQNGKHLYEVNY